MGLALVFRLLSAKTWSCQRIFAFLIIWISKFLIITIFKG